MKYLKYCVAASLAVASVPAFALNPNVDGAPELEVFVSGASAQDVGFENSFRVGTCQPGTLDIYRAGAPGNNRVIYCRIDGTLGDGFGISGFPAAPGLRVAIYKSSIGGSGNGVAPVANDTSAGLQFRALTGLPVTGSGLCDQVGEPADGALIAYTSHNNCGVAPNTAPDRTADADEGPDAGLSDVEPRLIRPFIATNASRLRSRGANHLLFGIAVSTNFRDALQTAQGLTVGSDTYENMPTLTSAAIAGAFTQNITEWSQLRTQAGAALPGLPADPTAFVCRRVQTSGSEAITEVHFARARCEASVAEFATDSDSASATALPNFDGSVYEGSGSSNVRDCLDAANDTGRWSIGLLSLENKANNPPALPARDYRYVKVDGYAPTLLDVVNGGYSFYAEQTVNDRNGTGPGLAFSALPLNVQRVVNHVVAQLSNDVVIEVLNRDFQYPWGDSGLLARPDVFGTPAVVPPPQPITQASLRAQPVNSSNKSPLGFTNNCQEAIVIIGDATNTVVAGGRSTAVQSNATTP